MANCESCGFEMLKLTDFGGGQSSNKYCYRCTDDRGYLKSEKHVLDGMVGHLMKQGKRRTEATFIAKKEMKKYPAWK